MPLGKPRTCLTYHQIIMGTAALLSSLMSEPSPNQGSPIGTYRGFAPESAENLSSHVKNLCDSHRESETSSSEPKGLPRSGLLGFRVFRASREPDVHELAATARTHHDPLFVMIALNILVMANTIKCRGPLGLEIGISARKDVQRPYPDPW